MMLKDWAEPTINDLLKKMDQHAENTLACLSAGNPRRQEVEANLAAAKAPYLQILEELKAYGDGLCPICGAALKYTSYGQDGRREECTVCKRYIFNEEFGTTEINIGPVQTGYHYTTKNPEAIRALIPRIGALVRGMNND